MTQRFAKISRKNDINNKIKQLSDVKLQLCKRINKLNLYKVISFKQKNQQRKYIPNMRKHIKKTKSTNKGTYVGRCQYYCEETKK